MNAHEIADHIMDDWSELAYSAAATVADGVSDADRADIQEVIDDLRSKGHYAPDADEVEAALIRMCGRYMERATGGNPPTETNKELMRLYGR